ncbi:MAG: ubiquitin family protein [Oscillospiraceae bacterium]|jgi:hypothetical protein|nr:ubiquitin family protein [Oscillospiraceae bacterium]
MMKQEELIALSEEELELVIGGVDPAGSEEIQIFVKFQGKPQLMRVNRGMTVNDLIAKVAEGLPGIPVEAIRLTCSGKQLIDGQVLGDSVVANGTVFAALRQMG